MLQELKRLRAEAGDSCARLALSAAQTVALSPTPSPMPSPKTGDCTQPRPLELPALDSRERLPLRPPPEDRLGPAAVAEGVFFDADGEGPAVELSMRCEAGWRYCAADREVMLDMQRKIAELKACRRQERARAEEALERVARSQRGFNEASQPVEERFAQLKEELASEIEATKLILESQIRQKLEAVTAEEELSEARRAFQNAALNEASLESGLKHRHRDVAEEVERMQRELQLLEEGVEATVADNERCRRQLHALRFETETERFAEPLPCAATVAN